MRAVIKTVASLGCLDGETDPTGCDFSHMYVGCGVAHLRLVIPLRETDAVFVEREAKTEPDEETGGSDENERDHIIVG